MKFMLFVKAQKRVGIKHNPFNRHISKKFRLGRKVCIRQKSLSCRSLYPLKIKTGYPNGYPVKITDKPILF